MKVWLKYLESKNKNTNLYGKKYFLSHTHTLKTRFSPTHTKRKDHAKRGLFFLLLNQDEPASAQKRYATAVSPLMCLRKISQSEDSSPVFAFFLVGLDRPPLRKVENG